MAKHFRGIMVPVMTPFKENGEIDKDAYRRHVNFMVDSGVHGLLVPSGTGEFANLTWKERELLVRLTAEEIKGKLPIVSLVSDCSTKHVLSLCEIFRRAGADEVMLTPPFYSHVNQRALVEMYITVADQCGLALWIYHQPGETKLTVDPETIVELSRHPNIVGIKIAAGNDFFYFSRVAQLLRGNDEFSILMGEDFATLPSYVVGGDGSVSSLANVVPAEFVGIWNAFLIGNYKIAEQLQQRIMDCFAAMVMVDTGSYQSACKTVLKAMGYYPTNKVSAPFVTILPDEQASVLSKAKSLKII